MLAKLGYNVFALDIYGKGIRPKDAKEAGALAGKYKGDRELLRQRAKAVWRAAEAGVDGHQTRGGHRLLLWRHHGH